jgi:signal transduction histidine kinase
MDPHAEELTIELARAGWPSVLHHLLAGVVHDLNGRATALGGLVQLLVLEDDPSGIAPELNDEVRRLVRILRRLDVLGTGLEGLDGEGVALAETMSDLVELQRQHRRLRRVAIHLEMDPAIPAPAAGGGIVVPLLLLLLTAAGEEAAARGGEVRIHVGPLSDRGPAGVRVRVPGARSGAGPTPTVERDRLAPLADRAGGRLRWAGGAGEFPAELALGADAD